MTPNSEVDDRVEAEPPSHERRRRETPEVKLDAGFRPEVTFDDVSCTPEKSVSVSGRPEMPPTFPVPVAQQEDRHHDEQRDAETETDQHELVDFGLLEAWNQNRPVESGLVFCSSWLRPLPQTAFAKSLA